MNDYSDLFFLIGAMVMFSMLTLNVSRTLVLNSQDLAANEVENEAVAVAQSIIEEAQWKASYKALNAMDTNGNSTTVTANDIDYNVQVQVVDTTISSSSTENYVIKVQVGSTYFTDKQDEYPVKLKYIKSF